MTVNGVKKSLSKTAQKILRNQKQPAAPTLFFGNLSFDTTEDSIRELLEAHREKSKQKEKAKDGEKEEPWIRKIRMGTFEDSGKCKGYVIFFYGGINEILIVVCRFAFVDFSTTEHATSALINPKNHHLNGRDLVVEYASAEAVRRGAPKGQKQKPQGDSVVPTEKAEKKPRIKKDHPPHKSRQPSSDEKEREVVMDVDIPESSTFPGSKRLEGDRWRDRGDWDKGKPRGRPKPGAALALAKRESAAIVPSQGQKITF